MSASTFETEPENDYISIGPPMRSPSGTRSATRAGRAQGCGYDTIKWFRRAYYAPCRRRRRRCAPPPPPPPPPPSPPPPPLPPPSPPSPPPPGCRRRRRWHPLSFPRQGVLVLDGNSAGRSGACVHDPSATTAPDGTAIAAQCCDGATCKRKTLPNDNDGASLVGLNCFIRAYHMGGGVTPMRSPRVHAV